MRYKLFCMLGVLLAVLLLSGCASRLRHETNYADKKTVLLYPVVNRTPKDVVRSAYFDERTFFAVFVDSMSDKGYLFILASGKQITPVSPEDLTQMDNSVVPEAVAHSGYDYSMAVSLDEFRPTNLAATRQLTMTCYITDNKAAKVIWKKRNSDWLWRGVLGGPLDALFKSANSAALPSEITDQVTTFIQQSPFFTGKQP